MNKLSLGSVDAGASCGGDEPRVGPTDNLTLAMGSRLLQRCAPSGTIRKLRRVQNNAERIVQPALVRFYVWARGHRPPNLAEAPQILSG